MMKYSLDWGTHNISAEVVIASTEYQIAMKSFQTEYQ